MNQERSENERPQNRRVGTAAALLALSVLLSRILGFGREALLSRLVGAGSEVDAYRAAFVVPDFLNYLLAGGALSIAFLPMYSRVRSREGERAAQRLLGTVFGTMGVIALLATALVAWYAQPLVAIEVSAFDAPTQALTVYLMRIVLPAQICFVLGGIVQASLFARERFVAAALAPLLYNTGQILGGWFLTPYLGVAGFAWGALAGAVAGPLLTPLLDAWRRVPLGFRFAPWDRDFARYLVIAAPLMLGLSLLTVDEWYGIFFGADLGEGAVAHLTYGRRLMLVPVAIVGQAIAAAALPTLARYWSEGRKAQLDALVLRTLQAGLGLSLLAAAAMIALAQPVVSLFYQGGAFGAQDTQVVVSILKILCFAIPAWTVQQIAVRAFYARSDTWRPMALGTGLVVLVIPLYFFLGDRYEVQGLALAGVIGMNVNALCTLLLARRLHGAPELGALGSALLRGIVIAALGFAAARGALVGLEPCLGSLGFRLGQAILLVVASASFAVLSVVSIRFLGDDALRGFVNVMLRRDRDR